LSENRGRRAAGFVRKGHTILALLIYSEGESTALKKLLEVAVSPLLLQRQTSGNAGDTDTQLRWSEPGIACEPILPTPAVMRTNGTRWARRRQNLWLGLTQGKDLNELPTPVSYPGATKRSTCHIHPPDRSEQDRLSLNRHRRRGRQETAHSTDAPGAIAFGP
jgi:hypothetical protein